MTRMNETETLTLRPATPADAPALRRLAALDSAPALKGEVLIALEAGEAVAALSLSDGRVVATPFRLTEDVVALLRMRAERNVVLLPRRRRPRLRLRVA